MINHKIGLEKQGLV